MIYKIIATGSKGNAVLINGTVLVDCGVPFKKLEDVYRDLKLVLITHEHQDHCNFATIKRLSKERPTLRFGCCDFLDLDVDNLDTYQIGKTYDYGDFTVEAIELVHDVPNCGYKLNFDGKTAIYITDTGNVDNIEAKNYDLYLIEANYDEEEIERRIREKEESGEYVYEHRVKKTHLSKQQADEFLLMNMGKNSKFEYLHEHKE